MLLTGVITIIIALLLQSVEQNEQKLQPVSELLNEQLEQLNAANNQEINSGENKLTTEANHDKEIENMAVPQLNSQHNEEITPISNETVIVENDGKADEATIINQEQDSNKININTATADQLQTLKGIGPSKAQAIIADREQKGDFKSIDEIKRVKGIGEKLFAGIKESIVALR